MIAAGLGGCGRARPQASDDLARGRLGRLVIIFHLACLQLALPPLTMYHYNCTDGLDQAGNIIIMQEITPIYNVIVSACLSPIP